MVGGEGVTPGGLFFPRVGLVSLTCTLLKLVEG